MALQKQFSKKVYGVNLVFEQSYIQIDNILGTKDNLEIRVLIFDDYKKGNLLESRNYFFVPSVDSGSDNFIKQGYEYLKALEEYKDAIDILEQE